MKKTRWLQFLIFSFFVGVIFTLLVYVGIWQKFILGLATISWWEWILYLIVTFYVTLTLHELGHFIAFYLQKIKLRALYLTMFVFHKTKKGWRFTIKPKLWVLFGGLVVPDIDPIEDEKTYIDVSNKFANSLLAAPIVTISFLVFSNIVFVLSMIFSSNYTWVGFITVFNFYTILLSSLYIYTFSLSNQLFYGDFVAYKKMKEEQVFRFVQINQYLSFGLNDKNEFIPFMWEKSKTLIKENQIQHTMTHTMLLMTYLEGIIYEGQTIDLDIDAKIKNISVSIFARSEHGLMTLYDICLYHYIQGHVSEAYELLDKIMDKQAKSISEKVKTYFAIKAKHVMNIVYDEPFLNNKENYPADQSWIFAPIMDIYKDMDILHKPLHFQTYETIVHLEKIDEEIKKSE